MNTIKINRLILVGGIVAIIAISFAGGYFTRGKTKVDCSAQDALIHQLQEQTKRDSNLITVLQGSKIECSRQAAALMNEFANELKKREKTIELLKNSNFVLKEGLEQLQSQGAKIDSAKFNLKQLQKFFDEY